MRKPVRLHWQRYVLRELDGFGEIRRSGRDDHRGQPGAVLQRGFLNFFPFDGGERRVLTSRASDDDTIGALILEVRHHVAIVRFIEFKVFVTRGAGRDPEEAFFGGCALRFVAARRRHCCRGSYGS